MTQAPRRGSSGAPHAEPRAAAAYLQGLAPRLLKRDLLAGAFQGLLRKPLLGRLTRVSGPVSRRPWLAQLLRLEGLD